MACARYATVVRCAGVIMLLGAGSLGLAGCSMFLDRPRAAGVLAMAEETGVESAGAAWTVRRVGGDMQATTTGEDGDYRSGECVVDTPLPRGYPPPTPPGAIELKRYPSVRRAEARASIGHDWGMNVAFWPLFTHISERKIEMTSPVEMDYHGWESPGDGAQSPQAWTMAFLYRTPDLGPSGIDGKLRIADAAPVTVLSVGLTGKYTLSDVRRGYQHLERWLHAQDEWKAASEPRALNYNGPNVPAGRRWMEVQVPVEMVLDMGTIDTPGAAGE